MAVFVPMCHHGDLSPRTCQVVAPKQPIREMMYLSAPSRQVYVLMMHLTRIFLHIQSVKNSNFFVLPNRKRAVIQSMKISFEKS